MKSIEWVGLVVAGVVSSSAVGQDLLVNGGLEGAPGSTCAQNFVSPGSNAIPGWVVSGAWNVDWMRAGPATACLYCPVEGSCMIDLNGSPSTVSGSAIRQFIPTVAGKSYRLSLQAVSSFYSTDAGTIKTLRVTTGVVQRDFEMVTPAIYSDCGDCPWEEIAVQFTATASETEIELRSMHPNSAGGIHIDQIQLVEIPCLGDLDASDSVTGVDLAIILTNWNAPNPKYPEADVNGDGAVDGADLAIVLSNWGDCP